MFDLFNIWQMQEYTFRLHEHSKFKWKPDLSPKDFMAVLANITAIKIRGSFVPDGQGFLDEVKLGSAARGQATGQATWIERSVLWSFCSVLISHIYTTNSIYKINQTILYIRCTCPPGYKGNFCELCVPGYYHENNGGPFARCIPCSCNGHTEFCDRETGNANDIPILISKWIKVKHHNIRNDMVWCFC